MEKGETIEIVYIERFSYTIKSEKLYSLELKTGHDAIQACSEFICYYNYKGDYYYVDNETPGYVNKSVV